MASWMASNRSASWRDFRAAFLQRHPSKPPTVTRHTWKALYMHNQVTYHAFLTEFNRQNALIPTGPDEVLEAFLKGLSPALRSQVEFYKNRLWKPKRNEQRYRGHDRAHHAPDSVTYSQRPGRSGAQTEQVASAPAYSAPSLPVSYPQAPPARSTGYQGKSAWAGGGREGGNQGPQASASSGPAMNNNSGNGQSSGSAQGPQGAQGAQPMEVGYIGRTATIQIIPSIDLEEEAVHESATAAASRPEDELVAAIGRGMTPTIFDHVQSTMRGSDLLSQFPQGERKIHREVCRTRFFNSQAGPSPFKPAAQGNGFSRPGRIYPKSGASANKPWVKPAPTAP